MRCSTAAVCCCLLLAIAASPCSAWNLAQMLGEQKIVGGRDTTITKYPFIVSVEKYFDFAEKWFHDCGGSVLNPTNILSAAHCMEPAPKADYRIRAGSTTRGKGGQVVRVVRLFWHRKFDGKNIDFDVGLFRLEKPLTYSFAIRPIRLPGIGKHLKAGTEFTILGWGAQATNAIFYPERLQVARVTVIDRKSCVADYKNIRTISPRMICADKPGTDTCTGDSGGPFVRPGTNVQYGITSWGEGCANLKQPGVYTSLTNAEVRAYIRKVLATKTNKSGSQEEQQPGKTAVAAKA